MASSAVAARSRKDQPVSQTVVSAVADLTGSEPRSLEPLYHAVDPDALNALFESDGLEFDRSPSRVAFSYCGCDVEITGDGVVTIERSEQEITRKWE